MSRVHLVGAHGDTIQLGPPRIDSTDAHALIADVTGNIADGTYTVVWRVAARDGHVSNGTFSFSVEKPIASTIDTSAKAPVLMETTPPESDKTAMASMQHEDMQSTGIGGILARLLGFVSIFLIVGAVTFVLVVLPGARGAGSDAFTHIASTNAATLGMAAAIGALLSTLLKIISEFVAMPDMGIGAMLFSSSWGWSVVIAALAAVLAFAGFWWIHSATSSSRTNAWRVVLIAAIALVVTPAFGGHAISSDQAWIAVPADIVHVTAGSMWIGTLAVIVFVAISACLKTPDGVSPGARLAALINAFSPLALICGGSVVATGVAASLIHAPHFSSLLTSAFWTTPYGSALFRKLIFVVLLMFVGAWNWRRMKPRLGGDDALGPMRRSATIELSVAAIVLALTAVLVALVIPE